MARLVAFDPYVFHFVLAGHFGRTAMQFAKNDPLLSGGAEFELRSVITPDELTYADIPEEWSEYRDDEPPPQDDSRSGTGRKVYGNRDFLQMVFVISVILVVAALPGIVDFVHPGFSGNFWQYGGCTHMCFNGAYVLYLLFVAAPACFVILNLPGWLWGLWKIVRRTKP